MRIKSVSITNFRSYNGEIKVDFQNFTAIVGKNDIGKSTILEALYIFFHNGKELMYNISFLRGFTFFGQTISFSKCGG